MLRHAARRYAIIAAAYADTLTPLLRFHCHFIYRRRLISDIISLSLFRRKRMLFFFFSYASPGHCRRWPVALIISAADDLRRLFCCCSCRCCR